ncbi:AgmX/PglI C-terminal domain-containing protein [Marinobacter sp. CHS3-4]|uniref:AgmX/PglI C-terminal domain-containing protein n=1 Tax=Marinobacter sp. CHS3-4 TaxID=3045174 RepID=UPI0024B5D394|nr:AgmX/PglI C-terminal domain-containing protein [Marinobacter sp. CHS3-4]MDI9245733.1 AgmX/PglI C-terminal domain-containing protein [Marinobacter sp. CHS3-4]
MNQYRQGLPWNQEKGERRRLIAISLLLVPLFVLTAGYISWVELPEVEREEREALPPQLARLVVEEEPPPPELKEPEPEPEPEEPEEPEPQIAEPEPVPEPEPGPEPEPEPEPEVAEQQPEPTEQDVQKAREKAKNTGILAMGDELSKLATLGDSVELDAPSTVTAEPIAKKTGDALAQRAETGRSSGVDESQLTQETKQIALAERQQAEVEEAEEIVAEAKQAEREQEVAKQQRTRESVRRTMDRNKSAIDSIYRRELRRQPSLQGTVTPELVIDESGTVSSCNVVASTVDEPRLEQKICNRLRLVNFGERPGVEPMTIRYPIELLPG